MRWMIWLIFIFNVAKADLSYQFRLTSSENNPLLERLLFIAQENSQLALRLGVNRMIEIEVDGWPLPNVCSEIKSTDVMQGIGDTIFFNQEIFKLIDTGNLYSKECFWPKILGSSLDQVLKELPFSIDLSLPRSKKEENRYFECRRELDEIRSGTRLLAEYSRDCESLLNLFERIDQFHDYVKKIKAVTYNLDLKIDLTSFGDQTLDRYELCKNIKNPTHTTASGNSVKMLGMSIVYMSPGFATSVLGHIGERYLFCYNGELIDKFFDYTKFNGAERGDFLSRYEELKPSVEYLNSLEGKIYIKERYNPASSSVYGNYQSRFNRDVVESWLSVSEELMFKALKEATDDYNLQTSKVKNGKPLENYLLLKNNCTHPIKKRLKILGDQFALSDLDGLTPKFLLNFLSGKKNQSTILYPSQRTMRLLNLVKDGESLFKENFRHFSKASKNSKIPTSLIIYPETHKTLNQIFLYPLAGVTNLTKSLWDTSLAIITGDSKAVRSGVRDIPLSVIEIFGIRTRFPSATPWSKEEEDFIYDVIPHLSPVIISGFSLPR